MKTRLALPGLRSPRAHLEAVLPSASARNVDVVTRLDQDLEGLEAVARGGGAMARPCEVFVRELAPPEAERLVKITRTAKDRVRLRRAGIVLASTQGRSAAEAAAMFAATAQYAREVIHAFNDQGFAALDPKWSGGRPPSGPSRS